MRFSLFLALKYLKPKRSVASVVTIVSVVGVVLGVAIIIIVRAVMTGFGDMWREKILAFKPHITIMSGSAGVIENEQAHKISLNTPDRRAYGTVAFDGPLFGIWSPSKEGPVVCLEPWYGLADGDEFTGNLEDRRYIQALDPGKTWAASYRITV